MDKRLHKHDKSLRSRNWYEYRHTHGNIIYSYSSYLVALAYSCVHTSSFHVGESHLKLRTVQAKDTFLNRDSDRTRSPVIGSRYQKNFRHMEMMQVPYKIYK